MHNLSTVIKFEVVRTLKKKTFWLAALSIPLVVAFIGLIIFFSNKTTNDVSEQLTTERYSLGVTDVSGVISKPLLDSLGAQTVDTKESGIEAVRTGKLDAYFYYPKDISAQTVEVYGEEVGIFKDSRYRALAEQILGQSVAATTNSTVRTVLQEQTKFSVVTYKDGKEDKGFLKLVAPGLFLVLFYFMIITFGTQMLTSITEEKENRVIEMILTTIKPTTLLLGKLFSLIILAFIQIILILLPIIVGYFVFKDRLSLPSLDLSNIPLDPTAIALGAVIFIISFLMYTGILMTLGAAMPTAKEANSFFGAVMAFTFGPLYAAPLFVSSPDSLLVQILSYFPLTSPIPLLLRNAVGNLTLTEAAIAIGLLVITTAFAIRIGVRIFRFGALEYNRRLSVKEVLGKN